MDAIVKKEVVKGILLSIILFVFNVYSRPNLFSISLSLVLILLFIAGDMWVLLPLKRKVNGIIEAMDDLAAGGRDLTKRVAVIGNDEVSRLARQFNTLICRLHGVIGQSMNTASQVASASTELSRFSAKMAAGSANQSSQVAQIAAAMDGLNATVNEVAWNAQTVADSAKQASDIAEEGGETVSTGIDRLKRLTFSMENTAKIISELGRNTSSIGEII